MRKRKCKSGSVERRKGKVTLGCWRDTPTRRDKGRVRYRFGKRMRVGQRYCEISLYKTVCIHSEICGHAPCRSVSGNTTFSSILFRSLILERSFGLSSLDSRFCPAHPSSWACRMLWCFASVCLLSFQLEIYISEGTHSTEEDSKWCQCYFKQQRLILCPGY